MFDYIEDSKLKSVKVNLPFLTQPLFSTDEPELGTTLLAFVYSEGVILAADSRTSAGSFIVSRCTDKVRPLTSNICACVTGVAAHSQFLLNHTKAQLQMYALESDSEEIPVEVAAAKLRNLAYKYKEVLKCGFLLGGYNSVKKKSEIIQVCLGGSVIENEDILVYGSGSIFMTGFANEFYRNNMNYEEAEKFAVDCIKIAMRYDGSSGGLITVTALNNIGMSKKRITENDF